MKRLSRREFSFSALGSAALMLSPSAWAQGAFPDRVITIINPFPPGGAGDILVRVIAAHLKDGLGQSVIVDNKAGAGGNIGLELASRAPADGYTMAVYPISSVMAPSVYKNLRYDPINDFTGVAIMGKMPALLVVHPSRPIHTVADLIAHAKANPGKLSYGTAGVGTSPHLYMESLKHMAGIDIVHVPYKGAGPSIVDQVAGEIDVSFQTATAVMSHVRSGQMRAIATSTVEPFPSFPDLPSVAKTVPGFDASSWFGIVAPAATPKPIVQKLNAAIMKVLDLPAVQQRWNELGTSHTPHTADDFSAFIRSEHAKWARVANIAGVKPE